MSATPTPQATINNRYLLEQELGQGRLSTVYCAHDQQTNTTIALKILHPHLRSQLSVVQRFRRIADSFTFPAPCSRL